MDNIRYGIRDLRMSQADLTNPRSRLERTDRSSKRKGYFELPESEIETIIGINSINSDTPDGERRRYVLISLIKEKLGGESSVARGGYRIPIEYEFKLEELREDFKERLRKLSERL